MFRHKNDLLLVVNPRAGGHNRHYARVVMPRVMEIGQQNGTIIAAPTLQGFEALFVEALQNRPKMIAIFGGDGTIYHVVNHLIRLWENINPGEEIPMILPLRGGTMNNLARDASVAGRADRVLTKILRAFRDGKPVPLHPRGVLRCTVQPGGAIYYGFVYANGLPYQGMREFYERDLSGREAIDLIFETAFSSKTQKKLADREPMVVEIDRDRLPGDMFLGTLVSTLDTIILHFRPFLKKITDPSRQLSLVATTLTARKLVPLLPAVFFHHLGARFLPSEHYFNRQGFHVQMQACGGFTLDGEMIDMDGEYSVDLSVGPLIKIPRVP